MAFNRELSQFASFVEVGISSVGITTSVGIGTTAPTSRLHVVGDGLFTGIITASGFSGGPLSGSNGNFSNLQVTGISTFVNGPVLVGSAASTGTASQRLQVTGGGYVSSNFGIGITNPSTLLHANASTNILKFPQTDGGDIGLQLETTTSIGHAPAIFFKNPSGNYRLALHSSDASVRFFNGQDRLVVLSSGNVGIATTSPSEKLDVIGNIKLTGAIYGPSELIIDPQVVGNNTGSVRINGDLYVDGTQTYINSTTIELADFNVGIATTVGTNALLDGAGIGIGSTAIRKTITWNNSAGALTSSEDWNLSSGKQYEINGTSVLNSTTLGSGVVNSSLTSVGTLGQLNVSGVSTVGLLTATNIWNAGITTSSRLILNGANNTADGGGQIYLNGATGNRIDFNTNGVAVPAFTTRSAGTKIVLYPNVSSSEVDYAFGIENNTLWGSIPQATNSFQHRWYAGTTKLADLKGSGELVIGTTSLTGTASQRLQVTGGAYVSENLGVGATNPLAKSHIAIAGAGVTTALILDQTAGNAVSADFKVNYGGYATSRIVFDFLGSEFAPASHGMNYVSGRTNFSNHWFRNASNATQMVMNNAGNLLIGTETDSGTSSQKLQVTGGAYVSGSLGIGVTNPAANANGVLQVNGTIGLTPNSQIRQTTNANAGTLQVWATQLLAGSNNSDTYSYSDGSQLASVGNGDNALLLDVGRFSAGGKFRIRNTSSSNISLSLFNSSTGNYSIYSTSNGNTGIGTNNPLAQLHVLGGGIISQNLLVGTATSTGTASQSLQVTGGGYVSGSLGIGVTNPLGRLSVFTTSINTSTGYNGQNFGIIVGTDNGDNLYDEGNGIVFTQQYASDGVDSGQVRVGAVVGYKGQATGNFGGGLKFKVQPTGATPMVDAMVLTKDGNLGIGATIPATKVEIAGTSPILRVSGNAGSSATLDLSSTAAIKWTIVGNPTGSSGALSFQVNDSEVARISNTGNVGITTTNPTSELSIGSEFGIDTTTTTVATTTATSVISISTTLFRSARIQVQISQGSSYQASDILLIHNGSTSNIIEYGTLATDSTLATFSTDISSNTARLLVSMGSATSATVRAVAQRMSV